MLNLEIYVIGRLILKKTLSLLFKLIKNFKSIKKSLHFRIYIQLFLLPESFERATWVRLYNIGAIKKSVASELKPIQQRQIA